MHRQHNVKLTDEDVIIMRDTARGEKRLNIRRWAKRLGVSHPTVYFAMVGKSFKDLPGALERHEYKASEGRRSTMSYEQIAEMDILRRSDPITWSYRRLAQRCNDLYGLHYFPSNVQRMLETRFPLVARPALPKQEPKPRVYKPKERVVRQHVTKSPCHEVTPHGWRVIDISNAKSRQYLIDRLLSERHQYDD